MRREGVTVRSGPLWCSVLPDPSLTSPHVAYALGRSTGGAVARNFVRRRLREIVRTHEATLPAAWILVGANASAVNTTFAELTSHTQALFSRVQAKVTSESPVSEPAASSQAPL